MFFQKRPIQLFPIDDAGELAEKLIDYSWCCCNGFDFGGIYFINDSTGADGAQEYAVVVADAPAARSGKQTNSITFGWVPTVEEALDIIISEVTQDDAGGALHEGAFAGVLAVAVIGSGAKMAEARSVAIPSHPTGSCYLCA